MSVSAWCLRSDSAVATTSSRQLGRCWKSPSGRIHFHSMRPTSSGSYTTASGSRRRSSSASVVLPAPNPPLSQMITGTSYPGNLRTAGPHDNEPLARRPDNGDDQGGAAHDSWNAPHTGPERKRRHQMSDSPEKDGPVTNSPV